MHARNARYFALDDSLRSIGPAWNAGMARLNGGMMSDSVRQAELAAAHGAHMSREREAFLYSCALDRGDFETMGVVLSRAEHDPELACILDEIHDSLLEEQEPPTAQAYQRAHEVVQRLLNEQEGEQR